MSDLNKEALDVWGGLKPMIDQEISSRTQGMVQRRKAKVTTAPSLATNTIGVTEAFGDEMFLPFVSNMISAKVGDFVWIEWMYGATNAFVSSFAAVDDKNITVAGTLDVVQRRCSATLSSAGWYRVLKTADVSGTIINFYIGRPYGSHQAETHKVSFHVVGGGKSAFVEETSDSNSLFVNKIRCTYGGGYMYFDVHYSTSSYTNEVLVYFDVYGKGQANGTSVSMGLTNVADSPSGETVLKEYSFSGNTECTGTITAGSYTESFYDGTYLYRQGQMVTGFIKAKMNATVPASAWRNIAVIPVGFRPYSSTDFLAINNAASNSGELHIQARIEQSTGNVVICPYTAIASGTAIYLSFTYRAYSTN